MDLRCKLNHKAGTSVSVNGTVYQIGDDNVLRNVPKADADKLLLGQREWMVFVDRKPVAAPAKPKPKVAPKPPPAPTPAEPSAAPEEPEAEDAKGDPEGSDGQWPEPTEEMGIDYLKTMADAYDVKYSVLIGKAKLVERLKAAMYE